MPEFSQQSIQPTVQVDSGVNNRPHLDVTARQVDTFVDPGVSNLQRLGDSLGLALQSSAPLVQHYNQKQNEEDQAAATQRHVEDSTIPEKLRQPVSESASEIYRATYMQLNGLDVGNQANLKIAADVEAHKLDPHYDPVAAASRIQAEFMSGITNKDMIKGMYQATEHMKQQAAQTFVTAQKEQQRQELNSTFRAGIADTINAGGDAHGKREALAGMVSHFETLGIPKSVSEQMIHNHVYAQVAGGDLGAADLVMNKDTPSGMSTASRIENGEYHIAQAIKAGQTKLQQEAIAVREKGAMTDWARIEKDIDNFPADGDPYVYVLNNMSAKGGYIDSPEKAASILNKIQANQLKLKDDSNFQFNIDRNPNGFLSLKELDPDAANKWTKRQMNTIWGAVDQSKPESLAKAMADSNTFQDRYPGVVDTAYGGLLKAGFKYTASGTKDAAGIEQMPPQFKLVTEEYTRLKGKNDGRLATYLSGPELALLDKAHELASFGTKSSADVWKAVAPLMIPSENRRRITTQDAETLNSAIKKVNGFSVLDNSPLNTTALQSYGLAHFKNIIETTQVDTEDAINSTVNYIKDNTAEAAGSRVAYPPEIYKGFDKDKQFAPSVAYRINEIKDGAEAKQMGYTDIVAKTEIDGTITYMNKTDEHVLRKDSPEDLMQVYRDSVAPIGQRTGDVEQINKLNRIIANPDSPEAAISTVEYAKLKPYYEILLNTKRNAGDAADIATSEAAMNKIALRSQGRDAEVQQSFREFSDRSTSFLRSGVIDSEHVTYPTDIKNPGNNNLSSLEYAKQYATQSGGQGASLTILAEGMRLSAYKDPGTGGVDIGIGYSITKHGEQASKDLMLAGVHANKVAAVIAGKEEITPQQALTLYHNTMKKEYLPKAREGYGAGFDSLPERAKAVLGDLAYCCGNVNDFKEVIKHMSNGDFKQAGDNINLSFKNDNGAKVRDERRIQMYKRMLAGEDVWNNYIDQARRQTPPRKT